MAAFHLRHHLDRAAVLFSIWWAAHDDAPGASVRVKVYPLLMSRAMLWFPLVRASHRGGRRPLFLPPALGGRAQRRGYVPDNALVLALAAVWTVAYALIYALQLPAKGILDNVIFRIAGIAAVVIRRSLDGTCAERGANSSNEHLAISVGGGLGFS